MLKCALMADFSVNLPDEPGELSRLAAMLRESGVNLVALWGYGPGTGDARFYDRMIPIADRLYDEHLEELKKEGQTP